MNPLRGRREGADVKLVSDHTETEKFYSQHGIPLDCCEQEKNDKFKFVESHSIFGKLTEGEGRGARVKAGIPFREPLQ